ncbi:MAG: hypothetical protein ACLUI3_03425 [Christensenellales bacterium]
MMGGVSVGYCGRGHGSAPSGRRHEESGYSKFIACNIAFTGLITATVPPETP